VVSVLRAVVLMWGWVAVIGPVAEAADAARRPNVVLILADDMGFSDLGCFGSEIATPNLDRLAAGGVRMTQFYNAARCCPTRAALLTGLYPHQAAVGLMVGDRGVPGYRGFLNDRCATIAEVLRPAGYHPLMVGKWHVGNKRPQWPTDRGFERYYGIANGGGHYFAIPADRTLVRDGKKIDPPPDGFYLTDVFTDEALKLVDAYAPKAKAGEPFFLHLAYTAPHWPLHAPKELIEKYTGTYRGGWDAARAARHKRQVEMGIVDAKWPLSPRAEKVRPWADVANPAMQDLRMAVYAAQVERMDAGIGRVMAKLKEQGIERETLVIFCSDNGASAEVVNREGAKGPAGTPESFVSAGPPWANVSNTPFRESKKWVHEGGIASPFVAYWPAVIKPGQLNTTDAGHVIDLAATVYDVAGVTYPKARNGQPLTPLEGKSLLPLFTSGRRGETGHEALYWEHEEHRAVRKGDWKLVAKAKQAWELYDLAADRTELTDLAATQAGKVAELKGLWEAWAVRCNVLDRGKPARAREDAD
jgi:arylsulfatase